MTRHVWTCGLCGGAVVAGEGLERAALRTHTLACPALEAKRQEKAERRRAAARRAAA